ncbi:MAG: hypothetical protein Q8O92_01765 [Candidatus Latescibacter sp.]|nr:hypothetical protein [Candidatus Latescibacter sp.]
MLHLEVETARVSRDRIHATVASSRREDAGQRKKRYAMGDKGKKDKDKSQKQKKNKEEQKKKKEQEKQPSGIPWQRGK